MAHIFVCRVIIVKNDKWVIMVTFDDILNGFHFAVIYLKDKHSHHVKV